MSRSCAKNRHEDPREIVPEEEKKLLDLRDNLNEYSSQV